MMEKTETDHVKTVTNIVMIGASAGGLNTFCELVANLEADRSTAYIFVPHLSSEQSGEYLVHRISRCTSIPCSLAEDGKLLAGGEIIIAIPDYHVLVKPGLISLSHGATENGWRPAIDVAFRSAAVGYREKTTGIILSGLLRDGTSGMAAIQAWGGATIVQSPDEAEYRDMPQSVLDALRVDRVLPVREIGRALADLRQEPRERLPIPEGVFQEARLSEKNATTVEDVKKLGMQSDLTCPDCGGILWEIRDGGIERYRCYTGHSFTMPDLDEHQNGKLELALWSSLRMMEEKKNLLMKMKAQESRRKGQVFSTGTLDMRLGELEQHMAQLRTVLKLNPEDGHSGTGG
ncbi:MAG: chemotaxis protein CheB [Chitinophagaceae bacterium]|nr:MAG: chemotaxis protein CheB [Chitinophagaceae bacterium]